MGTGNQMGLGAGSNNLVKAQILVLVDAELEVQALKECLTKRGYTLIVCSTVSQALSILKIKEIDLIVTQVHLVNECSFDFLREVKSDPKLCAIPFAFVRLNKSPLARQIDDVVAKPGMVLGAQKYVSAEGLEPGVVCRQLEECLPPRLRSAAGWFSEGSVE
jgi:response regulator RpfG family c-di-GMP phosphodiesterase